MYRKNIKNFIGKTFKYLFENTYVIPALGAIGDSTIALFWKPKILMKKINIPIWACIALILIMVVMLLLIIRGMIQKKKENDKTWAGCRNALNNFATLIKLDRFDDYSENLLNGIAPTFLIDSCLKICDISQTYPFKHIDRKLEKLLCNCIKYLHEYITTYQKHAKIGENNFFIEDQFYKYPFPNPNYDNDLQDFLNWQKDYSNKLKFFQNSLNKMIEYLNSKYTVDDQRWKNKKVIRFAGFTHNGYEEIHYY